MTNYRLWSQLGTTSQRALSRRYQKFGRPYTYRPRGNLLQRLARDNHLTLEQVYQELMDMRADILNQSD